MRFRLRTLMIAMALGPPVLALWGWPTYREWQRRELARRYIHPTAPRIIWKSDASDVPLSIEVPEN